MNGQPSNIHRAIESELLCPSCHAANRPGVTYVVADLRTGTAGCIVCGFEGAIVLFQRPLERMPA